MLLPWGFREYPGDFSLSGRGPPRAWAPGRNLPTWPGWPGWLLQPWPWRRPGATMRRSGAPWPRHLGPQAAGWPVVTASWPAFDQVNVQAGLDAWLAGPGLRHELLGLTGVRRGQLDLADLTAAELRARRPASRGSAA